MTDLEKLEAAVRKLAADNRKEFDDLRADVTELKADVTELKADVTELAEGQDELLVAVKGIQKTQVALTNAMTSAIKQLGSDKTIELRVKRLEDAVFGSKH